MCQVGRVNVEDDLMAGRAWEQTHKQYRAKMKISPDDRPWTAAGKLLRGVPPSPRMREAIDLAWSSRPPAERTLPFYLDLSQCITRKRWSAKGGLCLTTGALYYDYRHDTVWPQESHLALQGLPMKDIEISFLTPAQCADLAGEAIFLPCMATLMAGIFLNPFAAWWSESPSAQ